jgi:anti-sigma factor RsiW
VSHLGDRVAALVDGELDHESRDRALAHIATCDSCRAEVDAERRLKARIRALSEPELTADLNLRLLSLPRSPLGEALPPGSMYLNPHLRRDRARFLVAAAACILALTLSTAFAVGGAPAETPVRPAVDQYAVEHTVVVSDVPLSDAFAGSDVVSTVYPSLTAATQPETMQLLPTSSTR